MYDGPCASPPKPGTRIYDLGERLTLADIEDVFGRVEGLKAKLANRDFAGETQTTAFPAL